MNIQFLSPDDQLFGFLHKISLFTSQDEIKYNQKLTPSPFTCISYNHHYIPEFKVSEKVFSSSSQLQITGPKTLDNIYAMHNGRLSQILFEFTPTGFYYIFKQSPTRLVNRTISLSEFVDEKLLSNISGQLVKIKEPITRVKLLEGFLIDLKFQALIPIDYIEKAILLVDESFGNISVRSVCEKVGKSERQFNRKFNEIVGIPPLQYIKIRQLHFIINLIHLKQYQSIKELAWDTGFYDPAHFNNSFKKLTGMSPGTFIQSDEHVALDYYTDLI
jgi:AraC-like DNA-binding protein